MLKQTELNPREFLFERLPLEMGSYEYRTIGFIVKRIQKEMDFHMEWEMGRMAAKIKELFQGKKEDNLKACLLDWYRKQSGRSKNHVLNKKVKNFMEYLSGLQTNDEREIVAVLSKQIEDIYVEDWTDQLSEHFLRDLKKIKQKVEGMRDSSSVREGKQEIFLKTADGNEIRKFYDADIKDSTSRFLKNMIEEALDNFGDSLETNQKVAVLVETLEKLLR